MSAESILDLAHRAEWSWNDVPRAERRFLIAAAKAGVEAGLDPGRECWCSAHNADDGPCALCELRAMLGVRQPAESRYHRERP